MTVRLTIRNLDPLPSAQKGRATTADTTDWTPRQRLIRTCCRCGTVYINAGYAWRCEHWHEALA